jgi:GNAT superfamily N-acetyltransferase
MLRESLSRLEGRGRRDTIACSTEVKVDDCTNIELREPKTPEEFQLYYGLRWRILREPWTQHHSSSQHEHEQAAMRLGAWIGGQLVGVGRLHFNSKEEAQVRYMAVPEGQTARGIGSLLLKELERRARGAGVKRMVAECAGERDRVLSKTELRARGPVRHNGQFHCSLVDAEGVVKPPCFF